MNDYSEDMLVEQPTAPPKTLAPVGLSRLSWLDCFFLI